MTDPILGNTMQTCLQQGLDEVSSEQDCRDAQAALGKAWGRVDSWTNRVHGCFLDSGQTVYWNTYTGRGTPIVPGSSGAPGDSKVVCWEACEVQ